MDSITFLQTQALKQLEKASSQYNKARVKEVALKTILDEKERESYSLRVGSTSETNYQGLRREFISEAKSDYENAQNETRAVIKRTEILKNIIDLHKFLYNNTTQQINLEKYK